MQISNIPYKFQHVWGVNATSGFVTSPIPDSTTSPAASQQLGFPPATSVPVAGGGTPPNIDDFNGAFQYLTEWVQWSQAGLTALYDATFQSQQGGYPLGALVASVAYPTVVWQSTVDNNTSDPDTGGANWQQYPPHGGQSSTVSFTFTFPVGVTEVTCELWGGGGPGGNTTATSIATLGGPGGGAGYTKGVLKGVPGQTIAVTVGAGGVGGSGAPGGDSHATDGTTTLTAHGGAAGANQSGVGVGAAGAGGTATGGYINLSGFRGILGYVDGSGAGANTSAGGSSFGCGNALASFSIGAALGGFPGEFPGQGGCGSVGGGTGGNGFTGLAIITW